jgi:5'-3' exoribonuclease 2
MARLAVFLRTYVAQRQLTGGPLWRKLAVIIDDSGSPGEGEHKLIDYIRNWRRSSDYSPEMVHAICGQDADLIMLGLSLHEPRVIILRERVDPPKKGKGRKEANKGPEEPKGLDFLRIDRLRQYLLFEFAMPLGQPGALPFPFDLEKVLDDFVFLCFFVGNDFLPHLPSLAIREGGTLCHTHRLPPFLLTFQHCFS